MSNKWRRLKAKFGFDNAPANELEHGVVSMIIQLR